MVKNSKMFPRGNINIDMDRIYSSKEGRVEKKLGGHCSLTQVFLLRHYVGFDNCGLYLHQFDFLLCNLFFFILLSSSQLHFPTICFVLPQIVSKPIRFFENMFFKKLFLLSFKKNKQGTAIRILVLLWIAGVWIRIRIHLGQWIQRYKIKGGKSRD